MTTKKERMSLHTILGAGGVIGSGLLRELGKTGEQIRLVGRNPRPAAGAKEVVAADLSDLQATMAAIAGSSVVYLTVGLKYDLQVWQDLWPKIMHNTIEACKRANAKLVFFDNVYMYGKVDGPMTEETPFNPCSRKGEIRARIATQVLEAVSSGSLTALIARAADFYGPHARTGVANVLVFDKLAKGQKAAVLANDSVRHSYTFTPEAAKALVVLAGRDSSWNQTWHLPTASDPPTGREFIEMVSKEFGIPARHTILRKWMIRVAGAFDPPIRELPEMLYQNESEYLFDSSKFTRAFGFTPTSYADGIRETVAAYR